MKKVILIALLVTLITPQASGPTGHRPGGPTFCLRPMAEKHEGIVSKSSIQERLKQTLEEQYIKADGNASELARSLEEPIQTIHSRLKSCGILDDPRVEERLKQRQALLEQYIKAGGNASELARSLEEPQQTIHSRLKSCGILDDPKVEERLKQTLEEQYIKAGGNASELARRLGEPIRTIHLRLKSCGILRKPMHRQGVRGGSEKAHKTIPSPEAAQPCMRDMSPEILAAIADAA